MAHETRLKFFKKWAAEKVLVIGTHFATWVLQTNRKIQMLTQLQIHSPTAGYIKDHGDRFELDVGKEGAKLAAESATRL